MHQIQPKQKCEKNISRCYLAMIQTNPPIHNDEQAQVARIDLWPDSKSEGLMPGGISIWNT